MWRSRLSLARRHAAPLALASQAHYTVPSTFDVDTHAFGPLSGLSREHRLLAAYECGALEPYRRRRASGGTASPTPLCTCCGAAGHWGRDCPAAVAEDAWSGYRRRREADAAAELAREPAAGGGTLGGSLTLSAGSGGGDGGEEEDIPCGQAIVIDDE